MKNLQLYLWTLFCIFLDLFSPQVWCRLKRVRVHFRKWLLMSWYIRRKFNYIPLGLCYWWSCVCNASRAWLSAHTAKFAPCVCVHFPWKIVFHTNFLKHQFTVALYAQVYYLVKCEKRPKAHDKRHRNECGWCFSLKWNKVKDDVRINFFSSTRRLCSLNK